MSNDSNLYGTSFAVMTIKRIKMRLLILLPLLIASSSIYAEANTESIYSHFSHSVAYIKNPNGSMGTGFLVSPSLLVSNRHVIFGIDGTKATPSTKFIFKNNIVASYSSVVCSKKIDLCIVKLKEKLEPFIGTSFRQAKVGEDVVVIGHPEGMNTQIISKGIISSEQVLIEEKDYSGVNSEYLGFMIDAAISKGSSGSPILSKKGEVLGIVVALHENAQNLNFSICSGEIQKLIAEASSKVTSEDLLYFNSSDVIKKNTKIATEEIGELISEDIVNI